jgi:NADPH:quinone reductase-like Zn-dependent oxidoreductase
VARLLELLSDGGALVSYSWARDEPMWVDTSTLVGKHLTVRGFFVGDFDYRDKVAPVIREAAPLVADGALWRACTPWSTSRTRCNISSVAARSC